ncbi:hypothetical protein O1Q96_31915 [Streptomyces sp. Qhu-G9]|uniref:hypothetical protein n=1 Tax=Streptomyces sp. Qhu-G9 TaxID=3452799 RepID=UPI0022AC8EE3|nr:hypothetical protein [Streptomyces aurantiacus]WAU83890.1 hypothetical protein O1Q96_31915 [Streptomyces aurantiacus]
MFSFASFGPISPTSVDRAGHEIGGNAAGLLRERIADRHKAPVRHDRYGDVRDDSGGGGEP